MAQTIIYLTVLKLVLVIYGLVPVNGECIFDKYWGRKLNSSFDWTPYPFIDGASVTTLDLVKCERLCLYEHGRRCAATVVTRLSRYRYRCDMLSDLPVPFLVDLHTEESGLPLPINDRVSVKKRDGNHCDEQQVECMYGGTCQQTHLWYKCVCTATYTGEHCETDATDDCSSSPCQNGGMCQDLGPTYECTCPAHYTGVNCETDPTDECGSSPCQHGGDCQDLGSSYQCTCVLNYQGDNCETDPTDECGSSPCENGGVCQDLGPSYQCNCPPHYQGDNCEIDPTDECAASPCRNGGVCEDLGPSYQCNCPVTHRGDNCETVDPCTSGTPCSNGATCIFNLNAATNYECNCMSHCTGATCTECCNLDSVSGSVKSVTGRGGSTFNAYVETGPAGGQWIVLMRNTLADLGQDSNFKRGNWAKYKDGFGAKTASSSFWLGNEKMYQLTNNGSQYRLRIDMRTTDATGARCQYADFSSFSIGPESDSYRLTVSGYSGNAGVGGDRFSPHNGKTFATEDRPGSYLTLCITPQANIDGIGWTTVYYGGWWYKSLCYDSHFTVHMTWGNGVSKQYLKYVDMKIQVK